MTNPPGQNPPFDNPQRDVEICALRNRVAAIEAELAKISGALTAPSAEETNVRNEENSQPGQ